MLIFIHECTHFFVGILEEAKFFGIESLVPQLESLIQSSQRSRDNVPLTRRDVVNALILTPYTAELRFQGVNLAGSDLSRLDLRYINFKVGKIYVQCSMLRGITRSFFHFAAVLFYWTMQ